MGFDYDNNFFPNYKPFYIKGLTGRSQALITKLDIESIF